ncbi:Uncharacterised protein [Mycobacterium tuberculosis]|nr:Uncharacterised protein [Mycobacterium tuberculosis]
MRVVDRVHHHAPDRRALALPPHPTGLAPVDVCLLGIAHFADGRAAADVDPADLTAGHTQRRVAGLLAEQLDARPGRARKLSATSRAELHGVDQGTGRDVAQWQVVARLDVGVSAGFHHIPLRKSVGCNDVALLPIEIVEQRNPCGTVRVVLDVRDLGVDTIFVIAAKVDHPVSALMTAAFVPGGNPAMRVASTATVQRAHQRLLRG